MGSDVQILSSSREGRIKLWVNGATVGNRKERESELGGVWGFGRRYFRHGHHMRPCHRRRRHRRKPRTLITTISYCFLGFAVHTE